MACAHSFNWRPSGCTSGAPAVVGGDGAEIVGHQRIAALRQRRGQRRFSRARGAAEQHRLAVHPHGAGMQHDLLALMQQDAEHGAENEDRDIGGALVRFRRDHDFAAVVEQKPRDVGNAQEELLAGDLPGRSAGAAIRQVFRHRPAPDRDLRHALGRARNQPRQLDFARRPTALRPDKIALFHAFCSSLPQAPKWRRDLNRIIRKNPSNSNASLRGVMSSPIGGRDKLQFLAAVRLPPVTSPRGGASGYHGGTRERERGHK